MASLGIDVFKQAGGEARIIETSGYPTVSGGWFVGNHYPSITIYNYLDVQPADEPEWMRLSTLVGAPAGAGVFRDNRAWHGATPNLSREVRAMPNVEYGAPTVSAERFKRKTMPHEVWESLSPHAQRLCRLVKEEPGVWPAGAGVMHPLANKRAEAKVGSDPSR